MPCSFRSPPSLDVRDPDEAKTVRRLIDSLRQMRGEGLIDSAAFDEQETIPEPTIKALAERGLLGITIPKEYGGSGLSSTGYARVFSEVSRLDPSLAVLIGVQLRTWVEGHRVVRVARPKSALPADARAW